VQPGDSLNQAVFAEWALLGQDVGDVIGEAISIGRIVK